LLDERAHLYEEVATMRLATDRTPVTELTEAIVAALEDKQ
ncbi:MAG: shikimate kinase, partial [Actinobacteria bacterium]|nr:shikimate kinase [Actinomycetota bacterium]